MIRAAQSSMKTTERAVATNRQTRWHEYATPWFDTKSAAKLDVNPFAAMLPVSSNRCTQITTTLGLSP